MKIKLAILDKDQNYLNRIAMAFGRKYADKLEIYSFTDPVIAMSTLDSSRIEMLLASDAFEIDVAAIPKRCGFAYFIEDADIDSVNGQYAICKYQKADLIYKQILAIYSENAGNLSGLKMGDENTKMLVFASPCGGAGTSTMAAACARYFAAKGQKVLYLNLEKFGSSDVFFSAEGQFDMSDIVFALKSKKANFGMKLESCVRQDRTGVYFYSQSKIALDVLELSTEEILHLISEIKMTGLYDYIVLDIDFALDKETLKIYRQAYAFVWIGDGRVVGNTKLSRAYSALSIIEQKEEAPLMDRICLIYNKFSNKTGQTIEDGFMNMIGGAPRYDHASSEQIIEQLSMLNVFGKLV